MTAQDHDNQAFVALVSNQVQRVTSELNKLEKLLVAGMVDRTVLAEFRKTMEQMHRSDSLVLTHLGRTT